MSRSAFRDHFSAVAGNYRSYRPRYPASLFDYLASLTSARRLAWDCATGNGQAARSLVSRFALVFATDASAEQLARAIAHPRILYRLAPAESVPLVDASIDLVTVGQAFHWFDRERFFAEVRRVLRHGGVCALWSYGLARIAPAIDSLLDRLYADVLGAWWPPQRRLVDSGTSGLEVPFPFDPVDAPAFRMTERWTRDEFLGYLATWSAVVRFRAGTGTDPLEAFAAELAQPWPDPGQRRVVTWPLSLGVAVRGD